MSMFWLLYVFIPTCSLMCVYCQCAMLCSVCVLCVFVCYAYFFLKGALLGCQFSRHEICLRNTENADQRVWFDPSDAETEAIGKSSPNGLRVRVR